MHVLLKTLIVHLAINAAFRNGRVPTQMKIFRLEVQWTEMLPIGFFLRSHPGQLGRGVAPGC